MDRPLLVIGAGGHASVLIDALHQQPPGGRAIQAVLDNDPNRQGQSLHGHRIEGPDDLIHQYDPEQVALVNGIGSVDRPSERRRIFQQFTERGYSFAEVIHPAAIVSDTATLGQGVQLMAGAVIQTGAALGDDVLINTRASVDHDCTIEAHTHIAPGVTLSGNVHVGAAAHIGTGAAVVQSVTIGEGAVLGAGAVVLKSMPPHCRAWGSPARVIA